MSEQHKERTEDNALVASVASVADLWPQLHEPALYGLAGSVVKTIEPHSEADPAALLIQFLTAVGNLIGPDIHCMVEKTRHGLNLNLVLVGETSKGRKGTSWGHISNLFETTDPQWLRNRVVGGLSSGEGLIVTVGDDKELTTERRLLVIQGEFASVLKVMKREGNTLSPVLRDAWDSGNLRTLVKHNPLMATGAHISIVGHITRAELLRYLSDTEALNGFANRFLWVCVRRSKCLPEGGTVPDEDLKQIQLKLSEVRDWAACQGKSEIKRDDSARLLWANEYPRLSEGLPGLLGAATGRAEAQVLRMAAVYAVLDCSLVVRVKHLRASLAVWDYCSASARYIFGSATGDPDAEVIREKLRVAPNGLTRTDIRDLFKRHRAAEEIERALKTLVANHLATCKRRSTGGRDTEVWIATEAT